MNPPEVNKKCSDKSDPIELSISTRSIYGTPSRPINDGINTKWCFQNPFKTGNLRVWAFGWGGWEEGERNTDGKKVKHQIRRILGIRKDTWICE